ncbi:MAG: Lrp/AsnC ligand binding domain-containing protein [Aigarchaeota archaeon]|nr:Lrp/AsnC ligand binding domain-containing protein [Aigarchaeota archaeon]MDW7986575.1 Lrp/AsnC ligand binding domain-containing protein [Nitrososphaerota archaeon]
MVVYAYILLRCKMGRLKSVVEEVKKIENIKAVYPVTGRFDAVIEVEVGELNQLADLIIDRIQNIEGVERTETLLSLG